MAYYNASLKRLLRLFHQKNLFKTDCEIKMQKIKLLFQNFISNFIYAVGTKSFGENHILNTLYTRSHLYGIDIISLYLHTQKSTNLLPNKSCQENYPEFNNI